MLLGDFVTASDGTGLVHTAIAFGEDDFRLGEQYGLNVINPVRLDGTYDERIGPYAGRKVKDADPDLIEDLRARGRLLRAESYEHSYPHCWRCNTPLLYYAKPSWYIATSRIKDRLLAANETVNWAPSTSSTAGSATGSSTTSTGRCRASATGARRSGVAMPERSLPRDRVAGRAQWPRGHERTDPHRPFVDDATFPCPSCDEPMQRVPEVIDVWFDSGSMPFAQYHSPHEGTEQFEEHFPADFICEALDQTRGWFYSLIAVSTLLFDRSPYRNVVCLGLILDGDGRKMSKSVGNTIAPNEVLDRFGADALRWYFFTSKQPWDGYRFSMESIGEAVRQFLLQLWNTYGFYVLYANANGIEHDPASRPGHRHRARPLGPVRLQGTIEVVRDRMDHFDATRPAARSRRSSTRSRTGTCADRGGVSGTATRPRSQRCARACSRPPSCSRRSVRSSPTRSTTTSTALSRASTCATSRPRPRATSTSRTRWRSRARPFGSGSRPVVRPSRGAAAAPRGGRGRYRMEREAIERMSSIVREELNVRELRFVSEADELGEVELKPNYRALGPRFGKHMPMVAAAVAGLDAARAAATLREGGRVAISVDGTDHELTAEDLLVSMKPLEGYQVEREGSHAVALELEIDDDLQVEGWAREIVRAVQRARQDAGLEVTDRIALTLDGDDLLVAAARTHQRYIAGETLAVQISYEALDGSVAPVAIDGRELRVGVALSS